MSKIDHLPDTSPDQVWGQITAHVALPSSGPWGYQTEQHRRWHWLDYVIEMGAFPAKDDDWDWVYMLGPYADHANRVYYDDGGLVKNRRKVEPPQEPDA